MAFLFAVSKTIIKLQLLITNCKCIAGSVRCLSLDSHPIVLRPSGGQSHAIHNDNLQVTVTIKKSEDDFDWYFSDNHPASSFSLSIDTLLSDSQSEMIYVAGKFSSINSSYDENIKNVMSLQDFEFSANFKNEYGFESNVE